MKKIIILLLFSSSIYSQTLVQAFADRCTGEIKTVSIKMEGYTTVSFYNRTKTFTANDFYSGALRTWMEQTYAWWYALSACSTAQTTQTTTQTSTSNSNSGSDSSGGSSDNSGDTGSDNSGDGGSGDDRWEEIMVVIPMTEVVTQMMEEAIVMMMEVEIGR